MEKELVLIGLTISYLLIASVSDIKRKQVDDWISLGIAAIGLIGFRTENLWGIFPAAIMLIVAYLTGGRPGGADISQSIIMRSYPAKKRYTILGGSWQLPYGR